MKPYNPLRIVLAGAAAGAVNGIFGAGGGMVLVPLLQTITDIPEENLFPTSISIILPICLVSLAATGGASSVSWSLSLPYLIGSSIGGILAGIFGGKIPTHWLHKALGILILWGGIRYLC